MANRFGLDRNIDAATKRAVRQRCGFGCVICGCGIVQYHHFDPPFAEATEHDPFGITLLCGQCHDLAVSVESLTDVRSGLGMSCLGADVPGIQKTDYLVLCVTPVFPCGLDRLCVRAATVLMYDTRLIIGLSQQEHMGSPLRLNAVLTDESGSEVLRVVDNEWQVGIEHYDIRTTGDRLIVNNKPGDIVSGDELNGGKGDPHSQTSHELPRVFGYRRRRCFHAGGSVWRDV